MKYIQLMQLFALCFMVAQFVSGLNLDHSKNLLIRNLRETDEAETDETNANETEEELRPDQIATDYDYDKSNLEVAPSLNVTPNVTCLTTDDLRYRMKVLTIDGVFGISKRKRCPRTLPCQEYFSCALWRTGFISRTLKIDLESAKSFYSILFESLVDQQINEILANFSECVQFYSLDKDFQVLVAEHENSTGRKKKKRRKGKKEKRETNYGEETADPDSKAPYGSGGPDPQEGLLDCQVRIDDYMECFETATLKGTCYWAPVEIA